MHALLLDLLMQALDLITHMTRLIVREVNGPEHIRCVVIIVNRWIDFVLLNILPQ